MPVNNPSLDTLSNSWFSVRDYGAIGDGLANDTTAVQDALDAATAVGGVVYFPQGTYLVDGLTAYGNVTLQGAGREESIIKSNSAVTMFDYGVPVNVFSAQPICDLYLDGNGTGTKGIVMTGVANFLITSVRVQDFASYGLYLSGVLIGNINNCVIKNNAVGIYSHAATLSGTGYLAPNLTTIRDCRLYDNATLGLDWVDGDMLVLDGCDVERNGTAGNSSTGGVRIAPDSTGVGLVVNNSWFEDNGGKADIFINTPAAAGLYSAITDSLFWNGTNLTYKIYVEGTIRGHTLLCRNVQSANTAAGTADFFANGAGAIIYLDNCTGTTGTGSGGTVLTVSAHAAATVADTSTIDLSISGQQISGAVIDASITLAKLADLANQRLIGRNTAGTGVPEAVTLQQMLDWLAPGVGDVLIRGASAWTGVSPGTAGYPLTSNGALTAPSFQAPTTWEPLVDDALDALMFDSDDDVIMVLV